MDPALFSATPETFVLSALFGGSVAVVLYMERRRISSILAVNGLATPAYTVLHRWASKISPKRSAAGVIGGVILGYVSGLLLFLLEGWPLDFLGPWTYWQILWESYADPQVQGPLVKSGGLGLALVVAGGAALHARKRPSLHGDARWARLWELRGMGLRARAGLVLGRVSGREVRSVEHHHLLVAAPTGGGKGVSCVIPTCFSWEGSILVLDLKGENHAITSNHRSKQGKVFKFRPMNPNSHRYNPLATIRSEVEYRVTDVQQLSSILMPVPENSGRTPMWELEAQSLFQALVLYVLDRPEVPGTIGEIVRMLKTDRDLAEVIELVLERYEEALNPTCVRNLNNFKAKADKERSGVKSGLTGELSLWENPVVDSATAESDFRFEDMRRQKISVYVEIGVSELAPCQRLLNVFFQQAIGVLSRNTPLEDEPHKVLFLLDEFASLGRMDALAKSIAFLRGYGVRMALIVQGLAQLENLYHGAGAQDIIQNCGLQLFFASNDSRTTSYISEQCGNQTVRSTSRNYPMGLVTTNGSRSVSHVSRPLLLPQEVRWLDPEQAILLKENCRPTLLRKIRYYKDAAYTRHIAPPLPVPVLRVDAIAPRKFTGETKTQREKRLRREMAHQLEEGINMIGALTTALEATEEEPRPDGQ